MNPKDLAGLDPKELVDWLVEKAREARGWVLNEDFQALHQLLAEVREAARNSKGQALELLEVAEAFIAPLGGRNFGVRELAVQKFLREYGVEAETILGDMLARGGLGAEYMGRLSQRVASGVETLIGAGVVLRFPKVWSLAPGIVGPVREMLSPPVFRMWSVVEQARNEGVGKRPDDVALIIAGRVGVTVDEAKRFLRHFPILSYRAIADEGRKTFVPVVDRPDQGLAPSQDTGHWEIVPEPSKPSDSGAQGPLQRN